VEPRRGNQMKVCDLIGILEAYSIDTEILVEGTKDNFDEPRMSVAGVRPRRDEEFVSGMESEYVYATGGDVSFSALILAGGRSTSGTN